MTRTFVNTTKLEIIDGLYVGTINYKDKFGKYKKKRVTTNLKERGNKKEAQQTLDIATNALEEQLQNNETYIKTNHQQHNENDIFFLDYIAKYVKNKENAIQPEVFDVYDNCCRIMGFYFDKNLKLKDVTYKDILGFYDYLRNERKNKNVTIKHHAIILSPALREAYRDNLIPKNPYEFMPPLKREKTQMQYYDKTEIETLFKYSDITSIGLIVRMAAFYGFRRSELIGLKWQAVDFKRKEITIEHKVVTSKKIKIHATDTLKTIKSNRTLPLFKEIEDMLLRRQQEIEYNKKLYGLSYNQKFKDYVFVDDMGDLMLPDYVSKKFSKILAKNNLKKIRFHDLRHSCASLLVANNIPMKNIQEWLGHANYNTTADIYSHLDYSAKKVSASVIENALSTSNEMNSNAQIEKEIEELKRLLAEKEEKLKLKNSEELC